MSLSVLVALACVLCLVALGRRRATVRRARRDIQIFIKRVRG